MSGSSRVERGSLAVLGLLVMLVAAPALAQRGVPVERMIPPGFHLVDVDVPDLDDAPVRLRLAPLGQLHVELLVDVQIAPDRRGARAAARWLRETTAGELPELSGIGDSAAGDPGLVAFVRDEVLVVIRRVGGSHDAMSIARGLDAGLAGRPAAPSLRAFVRVPAPQVGESVALVLSPELLGAHVTVDGPGAARRTITGWAITRSGAGALTVRVVGFDRHLRRLEHVERLP